MAEVMSDSDSDGEVRARSCTHPPPKRRRIIDPSAITAVPIYSNKVNSSLQLKPVVFKQCVFSDQEEKGDKVNSRFSSSLEVKKQTSVVILSDSEEEREQNQPHSHEREVCRSPSPPPPPCTPPVRATKRANKKIKEINKKLNALDSFMSLSPENIQDDPNLLNSSSVMHSYDDEDDVDDDDDDDIVIVSDKKKKTRKNKPKPREQAREISLKFRWRTDVYKILVLSIDPLKKAVDQLAVKLNVPPSKILLLRKETELPVNSSAADLGLGIADIIDCVVITENKDNGSSSCDAITVRLQGKDKGSAQEYSIHKDAPLGSIMSQYLTDLSAVARKKVRFLFDGLKVIPAQTPSQLDMEDGDVIEVWT